MDRERDPVTGARLIHRWPSAPSKSLASYRKISLTKLERSELILGRQVRVTMESPSYNPSLHSATTATERATQITTVRILEVTIAITTSMIVPIGLVGQGHIDAVAVESKGI